MKNPFRIKRCLNIQQGDVILSGVSELPKGLKKLSTKGKRQFILAEGEHTGHKHVLTATKEEMFEIYENPVDKQLYLKVKEKMPLTHGIHEQTDNLLQVKPETIEHKTLDVLPGVYKFGKVKELTFEGQIREVQD